MTVPLLPQPVWLKSLWNALKTLFQQGCRFYVQLPGVCFKCLLNCLQIVSELLILLCIEAAQSQISFKTFDSWFTIFTQVFLVFVPGHYRKQSLVKWLQEMAFLLPKFRAIISGQLNHTNTSFLPFTDDCSHSMGLLQWYLLEHTGGKSSVITELLCLQQPFRE